MLLACGWLIGFWILHYTGSAQASPQFRRLWTEPHMIGPGFDSRWVDTTVAVFINKYTLNRLYQSLPSIVGLNFESFMHFLSLHMPVQGSYCRRPAERHFTLVLGLWYRLDLHHCQCQYPNEIFGRVDHVLHKYTNTKETCFSYSKRGGNRIAGRAVDIEMYWRAISSFSGTS